MRLASGGRAKRSIYTGWLPLVSLAKRWGKVLFLPSKDGFPKGAGFPVSMATVAVRYALLIGGGLGDEKV